MASLLRRIGTVTKGWLNDLMEPAQDPRQTFTNAFQRQRDLLFKVQQALGAIADSKTRLHSKMAGVREKMPPLEEQARRALIAGREDLARRALRQRQVAMVELESLEKQWNEVEVQEQKLALVEHKLAARIEAFHARQEMIEARYSAAEAQVQINEALGGVSRELSDLGLALQEAEDHTEHMQARASVLDDLFEIDALDVPVVHSGDLIERQLFTIDITQAVEEQLTILRQQLGEGNIPSS
jgi:phage shock protein A